MVGKPRRLFRNLWIHPSYQGKYIGFLILSCLLAMISYGSVFYVFVKENFDSLMEVAPVSNVAQQNLRGDLNLTIINLLIVSFVFLVFVFVVGLLMSHKVAGPIYKIRQVCSKINRGDKSARVRIRRDDEFKEVVIYLNYTLDRLQHPEIPCYKIIRSKKHVGEILNLITLKKLLSEGELNSKDLVVEFEKSGADITPLESVLASVHAIGS